MADEIYSSIIAKCIEGEKPRLFSGCGTRLFFQQLIEASLELKYLQEFTTNRIEKVCVSFRNNQVQEDHRHFQQRGRGKDLVDQVLLQEVLSEDQQWSCFDDEEMAIKNDIICSIMKRLIDEAVDDILEIL